MERVTALEAREIMGKNFIGALELEPFIKKLGLKGDGRNVPEIPYSRVELEKYSKNYILILGIDNIGGQLINIRFLRDIFGVDPEESEPCFYNQDWYMAEELIFKTLTFGWYLIKINVFEDTRAQQPSEIISKGIKFPSAILCTYTFFAYYFFAREYLWWHDFVWCSDFDHNGDRIYVGKYNDVDGVNKNGFSVHRYLALRPCYGAVMAL